MDDRNLQIRLAEDIALLEFLGSVPVDSSRNSERREDLAASPGRAISARAERDLTTTLAFLSGIRDDPRYITAVCVQEVQSLLRVYVAANGRGPGPSPYLDSVKTGFDGIFQVLRRAKTSTFCLQGEWKKLIHGHSLSPQS